MSASAASLEPSSEVISTATEIVEAATAGLTADPKTLPPWLFYDEIGSRLFEDITRLPEYYLTRTERELFRRHAGEIFDACEDLNAGCVGVRTGMVELGAGTATKTGLLLEALARRQGRVLYQPIDISPSALDEAALSLRGVPGLEVAPCVANYITERVCIERRADERVLALYIGSSIGNFSPSEAREILRNLRQNLQSGDALLLGTDLAPSSSKPVDVLLAAYNDAEGVTAKFNLNILRRLNRELGANFRLDRFRHVAHWNASESRIEMHLQSTCSQQVALGGPCESRLIAFAPGETIHTENSHKFTTAAVNELLGDTGYRPVRSFQDEAGLFAVTLAGVI